MEWNHLRQKFQVKSKTPLKKNKRTVVVSCNKSQMKFCTRQTNEKIPFIHFPFVSGTSFCCGSLWMGWGWGVICCSQPFCQKVPLCTPMLLTRLTDMKKLPVCSDQCLASWLVECLASLKPNCWIFLDTINVISVKLCSMVLFAELFLCIPFCGDLDRISRSQQCQIVFTKKTFCS